MQINSTHSAAGASNPTTPTTPTTPAVGGSSSTSSGTNPLSTTGTTLGGTDFLTLMLAQLQNQDPTNPVDSSTFLTQLSELSEVQGITQLNTSFTALSNSLSSSQALQASSLLGHQALVASSTATPPTNGATTTGAPDVAKTALGVTVSVSKSAGVIVQQINLGAQSTGIANFSWNGPQSDCWQAPAGQYTLSANVDGVASGTAIGTYVNGTVQSVTMGAGSTGLTLNIAGLGSVPFSSVMQISN